jgi:hypothetical protein
LGSSASGFAYEPEFITPAEEHALLATIATLTFTNAHYKEYTAKRRIVVYDSEIPEYLHPLRKKTAEWLGIPAETVTHALVSDTAPAPASAGIATCRTSP